MRGEGGMGNYSGGIDDNTGFKPSACDAATPNNGYLMEGPTLKVVE